MQDAANAIIDADTHATVDAPSSDATPHPAGISRNWSGLYVWLQYCQWYKVLCWLLVLVLGGSEGLLPASVREAFRLEELLLASDTRAQARVPAAARARRSACPPQRVSARPERTRHRLPYTSGLG